MVGHTVYCKGLDHFVSLEIKIHLQESEEIS